MGFFFFLLDHLSCLSHRKTSWTMLVHLLSLENSILGTSSSKGQMLNRPQRAMSGVANTCWTHHRICPKQIRIPAQAAQARLPVISSRNSLPDILCHVVWFLQYQGVVLHHDCPSWLNLVMHCDCPSCLLSFTMICGSDQPPQFRVSESPKHSPNMKLWFVWIEFKQLLKSFEVYHLECPPLIFLLCHDMAFNALNSMCWTIDALFFKGAHLES